MLVLRLSGEHDVCLALAFIQEGTWIIFREVAKVCEHVRGQVIPVSVGAV